MVPGLRIHGPRVRPVPGGASDHVAHLAEKFPFVPSARLHPPLLGKKGIAAHQVAQSDKFHEFPARNAAQIKPGADGRQPLDGNGGIPRTAGIHPGQGVRIFGTVNMDHIGTRMRTGLLGRRAPAPFCRRSCRQGRESDSRSWTLRPDASARSPDKTWPRPALNPERPS